MESSPEDGELRKSEFKNADQLIDACAILQPNADVRYVEYPSGANVDGQPLVSVELQRANAAIVNFIKTNHGQIAEALWEANIPVRNNIASLEDAEIENLLLGDGGYGVTNVLLFMADNSNAQIWGVYQTLLDTTDLGQLAREREEIVSNEFENLRETSNWQKLARRYLDAQ